MNLSRSFKLCVKKKKTYLNDILTSLEHLPAGRGSGRGTRLYYNMMLLSTGNRDVVVGSGGRLVYLAYVCEFVCFLLLFFFFLWEWRRGATSGCNERGRFDSASIYNNISTVLLLYKIH